MNFPFILFILGRTTLPGKVIKRYITRRQFQNWTWTWRVIKGKTPRGNDVQPHIHSAAKHGRNTLELLLSNVNKVNIYIRILIHTKQTCKMP